jgi:Ca2+-binding RTX toxin-like protein
MCWICSRTPLSEGDSWGDKFLVVEDRIFTGSGPIPLVGFNDAGGPGVSELISQTFANGIYSFSGNQDIDAVLIGSRWTITNQTFSFPSDATQLPGYAQGTETATMFEFNAAQKDAVRYAFALVQSYTSLTFTEVAPDAAAPATHRFANTSYSEVGSAYGNFPSNYFAAGDSWFGNTNQPFYSTPAVGNWGMATVMHEIGHTMGLKHGMSDYTALDLSSSLYVTGPRYGSIALPAERDGQAWSLMTYSSAPGRPDGFEGEGFNQPQTFMQNDIAAFQYLYGANFGQQATNTSYTFSSTTGQMFINGVGQAAPSSNIIFRTIWDGNGVDTYDLSNYSTSLNVNLNAGAFSTFAAAQLANSAARSGGTAIAPGNVANALLYNGDLRSLIENAIGGVGNDRLRGNQVSNTLTGGDGLDTLIGDNGGDSLIGDNGNDLLFGDVFVAPPPSPLPPLGIGFGSGTITKGAATNNSFATAIDISSAFSLNNDATIISSTLAPHVTITGAGNGATDYYVFNIARGTNFAIDIDNAGLSPVLGDSFIWIYNSAGVELFRNDDGDLTDPGSTGTLDSYLAATLSASGTFYLRIGAFSVTNIAVGNQYRVHVSLDVPAAPVAPSPLPPPLPGVAGNDTLLGGDGQDTLDGGGGADLLNGGAGNDVASYLSATAAVTARLDSASLNTGEAAGDTYVSIEGINGSAFNDFLVGDLNSNALAGGAGADYLAGIGGFDTLEGGAGADTLDGGTEFDFATYATATAGLIARLDIAGQNTGDALGDVMITMEGIIGSNFGDTLIGDASGNGLFGNAGADFLYGLSGADTLGGGNGSDTLDGGSGADALDGGDDLDFVSYFTSTAGLTARLDASSLNTGEAAGDSYAFIEGLLGSQFSDILVGASANNYITAQNGNDYLAGLGGIDTLIGDGGSDTLEGGLGSDSLVGGADVDYVSYFNAVAGLTVRLDAPNLNTGEAAGDIYASIEGIIGSGFNDFLIGDGNGNNLFGVVGNDYIAGLVGADTIDGGDGSDTLEGGVGADSLVGGSDYDFATYINATIGLTVRLDFASLNTGDASGDSFSSVEGLVGSQLGDFLIGEAGGNYITAQNGNDFLAGLAGNDTLLGDVGDDTLEGGLGADSLDGGVGIDYVNYTNAAAGITARLDFASLNTGEANGDTFASIEGIIGSTFNDFLVGDGTANYLTALGGDDYMAGEAGADTLLGGDGADQFWGGLGGDVIDGGAGYDIARYDFAATAIVARLDGGAGSGEASGDTYLGVEALYGSGFGDFLIGDGAGNVLAGLAGGDLLYGLGGNDVLLGGAGVDAFAYNTVAFGADTILDFASTAAAGANHDYVDFRGIPTLSSFAISQSGSDALVTTNQGTVRLQGITASTLVAGDFLF